MSKINSSARPPGGDKAGRELATAVIAFHESLARRVGMSAAESRTLTKLNELGVIVQLLIFQLALERKEHIF